MQMWKAWNGKKCMIIHASNLETATIKAANGLGCEVWQILIRPIQKEKHHDNFRE